MTKPLNQKELLTETNSKFAPFKRDGWKMIHILLGQKAYFQGEVLVLGSVLRARWRISSQRGDVSTSSRQPADLDHFCIKRVKQVWDDTNHGQNKFEQQLFSWLGEDSSVWAFMHLFTVLLFQSHSKWRQRVAKYDIKPLENHSPKTCTNTSSTYIPFFLCAWSRSILLRDSQHLRINCWSYVTPATMEALALE